MYAGRKDAGYRPISFAIAKENPSLGGNFPRPAPAVQSGASEMIVGNQLRLPIFRKCIERSIS